MVEGGKIGTVHTNGDGSEDLGVMQINTRWIGPLARYARLPPIQVYQRLIDEPCFNIAAAGAIMRTYLNEAHGDLMLAVGYYHSHTRGLRELYQTRVVGAASILFGAERRAR